MRISSIRTDDGKYAYKRINKVDMRKWVEI